VYQLDIKVLNIIDARCNHEVYGRGTRVPVYKNWPLAALPVKTCPCEFVRN